MRAPFLKYLFFLSLLSLPLTSHADKIDDYIKRQMTRQHIPGLSLAVVRDGKIIKTKGYGLADVESNVPAKPETVYQLASVTKQFVAAGIMLLVEEGKIGLDDPISRYVEKTPDTWKEITVRHLLTHTSGIKDHLNELPHYNREDVTPEQIVQRIAPMPLNFPPGS
jgi:CubicO group peptidase (beta-lactamase class C family)